LYDLFISLSIYDWPEDAAFSLDIFNTWD